MAGAGPIVDDLRAESDELDALVAPLAAERWTDPTPAAGWTIAHQIGHLLWTDRVALTAVTDEARFAEFLAAAAANPTGFVDDGADEMAARPPAELLGDWRLTRAQLHEALLTVPDGRKLPWFGPPMSAASMATARLMETWAHGLDVADTLGVQRPATPRLRSIAHLGVRTRDYSFVVNGLTPPAEPFLVELRAPDGSTWSWGPDDASQRVTGSAEDFCFLVTQRRPLATLDIAAHGADAQRWLTIAQAFAGPRVRAVGDERAKRDTAPPGPAVGDERAKRDTAREMSTAGCEKHGGSSSPAVTEARLAAEQRTHWQQTYAAHPHLYGDQPSEAAKNALAVFRSTGVSALLDLGSGHGRDALFFARNGIAVHVIDFSPTALQQLADTAAVQGLTGRITVTEHDIRYPLPVPAGSVDAVFAHMLLCMAFSTNTIRAIVSDVRRVLRPGGVFVYTVRHTGDAHYRAGIPHGDDIYEHGGFAVHYFSRRLIEELAVDWTLIDVHEFCEGELPRRLFCVTQIRPAD